MNGDDEDDELDDLAEQLSTLTIDTIKSHCEPQYPQQVGNISKNLDLENIFCTKLQVRNGSWVSTHKPEFPVEAQF